jgi:ABC-type Mn2+/Zn2+ transport system ATPase subunit/GNAT superfamily N-acetyltransferase
MPSAKFVIETPVGSSFRVNKIKSMFDVDVDVVKKEFDVNIPIENIEWNIGLIVGASGSGKTTIAKKLFSDFDVFNGFDWRNSSLVDDFSQEFGAKEITESLSSVGFSSPPDWLKPFAVLSNGQKMRVELARVMLEAKKPIVYDEFTSVVDRQVAKIGSSAIQKFIKKTNKQFVALSCHYDIEEWLQPDWVFDANENRFYRRSLQRPAINVGIRKATQNEWKLFENFHYLSSEHNNAAHKYVAEIDGVPAAWCSVLHFPHPVVKNMKRIHRIVVRPDYQGIGLGVRFMSEIAALYNAQKHRVSLVTSAPSFVHGLQKRKDWVMTRKPGRVGKTAGVLAGSTSDARLTATFEYAKLSDIKNARQAA